MSAAAERAAAGWRGSSEFRDGVKAIDGWKYQSFQASAK
jgi:hypothetical protein